MDQLPVEMVSEISRYACSDGGLTGRSLSETSRFMRDASAPYKYQSLIIVGINQLNGFVGQLEDISSHLFRVKSLFVTDMVPKGGHLHKQRTQQRVGFCDWETAEIRDKRMSMFECLLNCVAPSIERLSIAFSYGRDQILLRDKMPNLMELTVRGSFLVGYSDRDIAYPSLQRLHIAGIFNYTSLMLTQLGYVAPNATHLRITPMRPPGFYAHTPSYGIAVKIASVYDPADRSWGVECEPIEEDRACIYEVNGGYVREQEWTGIVRQSLEMLENTPRLFNYGSKRGREAYLEVLRNQDVADYTIGLSEFHERLAGNSGVWSYIDAHRTDVVTKV